MCKKEEACEGVAGPVERKGSPGPTLVSNSSLFSLRLPFNSSMFPIEREKERECVCVSVSVCVYTQLCLTPL